MSDESKIRDAADAVQGLVKSVPIYQDALQPAMQEVGRGLQTVAKTIHIALAPISALVWGWDRVKDFVVEAVAEKLKNVPPERVQTPEPNVVGPALEALRYTGHKESLRDLYANLIATSLDKDTAMNAHPSFVEIIRSMAPDEAKIMHVFTRVGEHATIDVRAVERDTRAFKTVVRNFSLIGEQADCEHPSLTPSYLENLGRFGLLQVPGYGGTALPELAHEELYLILEREPEIEATKRRIAEDGMEPEIVRKAVGLTVFGGQFSAACVLEHSSGPQEQA